MFFTNVFLVIRKIRNYVNKPFHSFGNIGKDLSIILPIHKNSLFDYLDLHLELRDGRLNGDNDFLNTMVTLETTLRQSHDWAIDRMHLLCEQKNIENAHAIQSEFSEWLNPDIPEHDVFSLEYIGEEDDIGSS